MYRACKLAVCPNCKSVQEKPEKKLDNDCFFILNFMFASDVVTNKINLSNSGSIDY
jgi:hypothetical protein